jgi:hypothetical protein
MGVYRNNPQPDGPVFSPSALSFSPAQGPAGTLVTITGNSFNADTAKNRVYFGATRAEVVSATATRLMVRAPAGSAYKPVSATNLATHLTAYSSAPFRAIFNTKKTIYTTDFEPEVNYATERGVYALKAADIDGDGKADMVAVNSLTNALYVYPNQSSPGIITGESFLGKLTFPLAAQPSDVFLADVNGDGKTDVVVPIYTNTAIFLNTSTPNNLSFAPPVNINMPGGVKDLGFGDIDGDGRPEIIVIGNGNNIYIYANNSSGDLITGTSFKQSLNLPCYTGPGSLHIVDMNGDDKPDIAIEESGASYEDSRLTVFINTSAPAAIKFAAPSSTGLTYSAGRMVVADIDGDSRPDAMFTSSHYNDGTLVFVRNISAGGTLSFEAPVRFAPTMTTNNFIKAGDFDGDGAIDLLTAYDNSVTILRNAASPGPISAASFDKPVSLNLTSPVYSVEIADVDGDSKPDIALADYNSAGIIHNQADAVTSKLIEFKPLLPHVYGDADITLNATPPTNSTITFSSSNPAVATVSGNKVHIRSAGFTNIIARSVGLYADTVIQPLIVSPAPLTITAENKTRFAGKPNPVFTFTFGGFVNADTKANLTTQPVGTTTATIASVAGTYPITPGGAVAANYTFTYVPGTLTLTDSIPDKKVVVFNPIAAQTYGAADIALAATPPTNSTVTYTSSNIGVAVIVNNKIHIVGAGTAIITATSAGLYVSQAMQQLLVAPAPLTVTAGNKTRLIGTPNPALTFTYSGFVNSDTTASIAVQPTATTTATIASAVGTYPITLSGAVSANYTFIYIPGTLTITGLPLNNFTVSTTSASCKGTKNGSINIAAAQNLNYTATLTGAANLTTSFTSAGAFNNLAAGTYSLCVAVTGQTALSQCYTVVIHEPKDLSLYSVVSADKRNLLLAMSGGGIYNIQLNGVLYATSDSTITLPLIAGKNRLIMTSDKTCQGTRERTLNIIEYTLPYPNPFESSLYINLGNRNASRVQAEVYSAMGNLVYTEKFSNPSSPLKLNLSNISMVGTYTLKLTTDDTPEIFKIIKK